MDCRVCRAMRGYPGRLLPFPSTFRLNFLMSKFMPTLLRSPLPQQSQEVDIDCAGAVSFSDSSCSGQGVMRRLVFWLRATIIQIYWLSIGKVLQVKDFSIDCSNSGDTYHLSFAAMQSNRSLYQLTCVKSGVVQPRWHKKPTALQRWLST